MRHRLPVFLLLATTLGCSVSSFKQQTSFTLEGTQVRSMTIEAPASAQRATVEVTSDVPVHVFVVASKDLPGSVDQLNEMFLANKKPTNPLASEENVTNKSIEASVPAKTEYQVIVYNPGAKSAQVKLTIQGKS